MTKTRVLTHHGTEGCTQNDLVCKRVGNWKTDCEIEARKLTEATDEEPLFEGLSFCGLDGEIYTHGEERVSKAVVRGGLGGYDMSQWSPYVLKSIVSVPYGPRTMDFLNADLSQESWIEKYLPTMAAEITGSVGVRQAAITRQDRKLRVGKRTDINPRGR